MKTFAAIAYIGSLCAMAYSFFVQDAAVGVGTMALACLSVAFILFIVGAFAGYRPNLLMWPLIPALFTSTKVAVAASVVSRENLSSFVVPVIIAYTAVLLMSDPEARVEPIKTPPVPVAPQPQPRRGWFGR